MMQLSIRHALIAGMLLMPWTAESPAVVYSEGLEFELREHLSEISVTQMTLLVAGEEVLMGEDSDAPMEERIETIRGSRDRVLKVEDGRPTRLQREYTKLERTTKAGGEENEESGLLEDLTLELSVDEDGEVTTTVVGDEALDSKYLLFHRANPRFDALLPEHEVKLGESWELDDEEATLFCITHEPELFAVEDGEEEDAALVDQMRESAECAVEVTLAGREALDGVECWILSYEGSIDWEMNELPDSFIEYMEMEVSGEASGELTLGGSLWIEVERRFPRKLLSSMEGANEVIMRWEQEGVPCEMTMDIEESAEVELEWELLESDK